MMKTFKCFILLAAFFLPAAGVTGEGRKDALFNKVFPYPVRLGKRVEFWKKVFYAYSSDDLIFHDNHYPEIVYRVVNFGFLKEMSLSDRQKAAWRDVIVRRVRGEILETLGRLEGKRISVRNLSEREREVFRQFQDVHEENKFSRAKLRVRTNQGLRDEFLRALVVSNRYFPKIEEIFASEGLPPELTRLIFVESMFRPRAESRKGALGIWQFMSETGRSFLRVNDVVDERLDPVRASHGAAAFLKSLYEYFRSWPLAITAYNHGPEGIKRGIRVVRSYDLTDLIDSYEAPSFGFASKNYYAEFLAAVSVYSDRETLFPEVKDPRFTYEPRMVAARAIHLPRQIRVNALLARCGLTLDAFQSLNPAIQPVAFSRNAILEEKMMIHLPAETADLCLDSIGVTARLASDDGVGGRSPALAGGDPAVVTRSPATPISPMPDTSMPASERAASKPDRHSLD